MSIGKRLRAARMKSGLMQRELAVQLGTRQSQVSKWERDKEPVPPKVLTEISRILYVRESWLRYGDTRQTPRDGVDKPTGKVSRKYCGGCFHFGYVSSNAHCNYIGNTGHCRPCPAGEGCTERITPAEWHKKNESVRVEFNGYYPELRQKRDTKRK